MERKLASIQKVIEIKSIPGADAIECISVLGWHLVAKKGEFKVGDLCVYYEVDSLLPITPEYEFLAKQGTRKSYTNDKEYIGYRLRTVRLRGQVSQGLALPLSIFEGKRYPSDTRANPHYDFKEGDDVTSLLGVVKYEPMLPASLSGIAKGMFPSFIPKTDETRIQAFPSILERYSGKFPFYVTEKVDGASGTFFMKDGELNVCSRNLNLADSEGNTFWRMARELNIKEKLSASGKNYALQGELIGPNINGNKLKLTRHKVLFFNIYDMDVGKYLDYKEFLAECKRMGLDAVPVITDSYMLPSAVDEVVQFATRKSIINKEVLGEGAVFRPLSEMHDADLGRLSFKAINPEYLIKFGE